MILSNKPKSQFIFFLFILFVINILQSYYTRLIEDEAYYWIWSKNLAFGYFDHPPLVAVWIKISSFFFNDELGVRFFSSISFTFMLFLIWLIIDVPRKWNYVWLFFLLVVSMALLNVYGFITTPDTPLLLFVALFLFAYQRFLKLESIATVLLLGFSMAAMLYSKYHGVLVIFFIVISNLSLLKNKKFWFAAIIGFLLFIPHIYWQYANDFASFRYHLFDRSKGSFSLSNGLMHIVNQIAIVGITFPIIYKAFFYQKIESKFEKSLQYLVYGFIVFFFFSTFSHSPQAQWTGVILIPLIVLTFRYFIDHKKARKWLVILGTSQIILLIVARIIFANENYSPIQLEPHLSKSWVEPLREKTSDKPLVFMNSYRQASIYQYYTGINAFSYSMLRGRKSQYDLSGYEKSLQGKNVFIVGVLLEKGKPLVKYKNRYIKGFPIDNYSTFQKVKCIISQKQIIIKPDKVNKIKFKFINTYNNKITFENVLFVAVVQGKKNKILKKIPLSITGLRTLNEKEGLMMEASFIEPEIDIDENTTIRIALKFYGMLEGFQGNKVKVIKGE